MCHVRVTNVSCTCYIWLCKRARAIYLMRLRIFGGDLYSERAIEGGELAQL